MNRRHLSMLLAASTFAGCDSTSTEPEATDLFVVEAFLFAGEVINDIRITETIPLSDTIDAPPINDAQVELFKNGLTYTLVATGDSGYYEYTADDLAVEAGDTIGIAVTYGGVIATGETVVPNAPVGVGIDRDTLWVPELGVGMGGGGFNREDSQLAASWDNPDQLLHYVVIESLEDSAESIVPDGFRKFVSRFRLVAEPTKDDYHFIDMRALRDMGRHIARVYRVNEEYAQLYDNRTQDSRDLNEPPSNIHGGLGVFSAFSSDSVAFAVVRETS
ncbi:DUF4249 family protein [Gemmatimonadota bacterium]